MDAQGIYGIDQMSMVRTPSYVERTINLSTVQPVQAAPTTAPLQPLAIGRLAGPPRFERSISHVLQRRLSQNNESPLASPLLNKPLLRWFETGSVDSVHLGSSVDVFSEDARSRISGGPVARPLETVDESYVPETEPVLLVLNL